MLAKTLTPTAEQSAIIEAAKSTKDSILISALAGAAKTSTLEMICAALPVQPILCLAFNKRIAEEMKTRLPGHVTVKTMNALGHGIWAAATARRLVVNSRKSYELLKGKVDALPRPQRLAAYDTFSETLKAIGQAKVAGYVPEGTFPHAKRLASFSDLLGVCEEDIDQGLVDSVLAEGIRLAYEGQIDFDDQIYMPCQPAGTKVKTKHGDVSIEFISQGEEVVSFDRRTSEFIGAYNHGSPITGKTERLYSGRMYEVLFRNRSTKATAEHKWLVRFDQNLKRKDLWFTYLMFNDGSFKLGQCQVRSVRPDSSDGFGLAVRCTTDCAEQAWILGVHNSLQEAKLAESLNVIRFGITDHAFTSEIGRQVHQIQKDFGDLWDKAQACLVYYGRDFRFPFWKKGVTRSFHSNFIIESVNLIEGIMEIPLFEGTKEANWQKFGVNVELVHEVPVYSLRVQRHELYVANGILTHNCLFGGTFPKFPLVMVDEAQDLSAINHVLLEKLATQRLIAVGDPFQSIYAFRGAVSAGMQSMQKRWSMVEMGLSTSFRCPRAIVRRAQSRAPHMNWPDWAEEGQIHEPKQWSAASIPEGAAIICRNNAPLYRLGFNLIRAGRGVSIVGADIGPGLVKILKKLGPETMTQFQVMDAIDEWEEERGKKAKSKESISDRAECLRVFAEHGATLGAAIAYAEHLFKSQGTIQLLSGHKSKGLEYDIVYHLDPWRIPSKYAAGPEALEQESNLDYVITTRARKELWLVNAEDFRG